MNIFIAGDVANQYSDEQFISQDLLAIIQSSDYSICNFEGCLSQSKEKRGLRHRPNTLRCLREAGFNLMLCANNHITDCGKLGLKNTLDQIKASGLDSIGAGFSYDDVYKPLVISLNGESVCIINICEAQSGYFQKNKDSYGYAWLGDYGIESTISKMSKQCSYTIVICHAGLEHFNMPLPQFRELYRRYCNIGASCVIGMHPHVAQGIEIYNNKLIAYSLGNFYFPRKIDSGSMDIENQSYSLLLHLENGNISYSPIFHKMDDLRVRMVEENQIDFNLETLSRMLSDELYENLLHEKLPQIYNKNIEPLFMSIFNGTSHTDSIFVKLRMICKYLFFKKKYLDKIKESNSHILRMFVNESYRYAIETTMRIKTNKKTSI